MKEKNRGKATAVLISILAVSLFLAVRGQEFPSEHHEVIVRLILMDVIIIDQDGNFVIGLTKDDFELYEDSKLRPIHSIELITLKTQKEILKEFPEERLGEEVKSRKRIYVIFDCINTDIVSLRRAGKEISNLLFNLIKEGFEIKIMEIDYRQGVRILNDFTSEAEVVEAIIPRIKGSSEVLLMQATKEKTLDRQIAQEQIEEVDFLEKLQYRNLLQKTISYLLNIIGMIKKDPGRKSVLLISNGFPEEQSGVYPPRLFSWTRWIENIKLFDPFNIVQKDDYTGIIDEIIRYSNTNHISFYCLNPSILESVESNFALSQLSEDTGGAYLKGYNKFIATEKMIKRDLNYYYELAYTPLRKKEDGKFHHIEVKVKRKGLRVIFRKGYTDYQEQDIKKRSIAAAFFSPSFYQDINFGCTVVSLPQTKKHFKFWGRLNIPLDQFRKEETPPEKVTFLFGIKEIEDVKVHIGEMEIDIKEDIEKGAPYCFFYFGTTDVKIRPGQYEIKIILTHADDKTGTWEGWIKVPDLEKERSSKIINFLMGKLVENVDGGRPFTLSKKGILMLRKYQFIPLGKDWIERGMSLPVFIQIFSPGKETIGKPEFYIEHESGQNKIQSELIDKEYNRRIGCHFLVYMLHIEKIRSGDYNLIFKLADYSRERLYKELKIKII